jgi:hypothetical protein
MIIINDADGNPVQLPSLSLNSSGTEQLPQSCPSDPTGTPLFEKTNPGVVANIWGVVGASFVRPANTTAYANGQLVANSVTAGSVTPLPLAVGRLNGGTAVVKRGRLTKSGTTVTYATFRAHFFKAAPTPSNGDGAAFLTSGALNWIGSMTFDMTAASAMVFTDGAKVIGVPDVGSQIILDTGSASQDIYALIEVLAAYVPANAETFTLALEIEQG